jgi:tRNA G18 (ribose-2'-O)-methylase SpoU
VPSFGSAYQSASKQIAVFGLLLKGGYLCFMRKQLKHQETPLLKHQAHISVVCDSFSSPANVGMAFRVCEALGVECLYLCGEQLEPSKRMERAARSTVSSVPFRHMSSAEECVLYLKSEGYVIVAIELTDCSIDLRSYTFDSGSKYALIVGAENGGISDAALQLADVAVAIPLFGHNSSMNVVTALSICLFECVRQIVPATD